MSAQPLTTGSEIAAYVVAHIIGIGSTYVFNPMIFATLNAGGRQGMIPAVALGLSLVTMAVVLLLFLALRRALANT
jgi:hypothetical protein